MVEEMIDVATMFTPFNDFDRLAASLFARQGLREMPMDLYRDGDQYILRADLPGIDPLAPGPTIAEVR